MAYRSRLVLINSAEAILVVGAVLDLKMSENHLWRWKGKVVLFIQRLL